MALLGKELVHGNTSGIIVETEAYSQDDAASHSYRGVTERTRVMFEPGGFAYIYFTYGMHYCFNVVSGQSGYGEAVLIRALEPKQGIEHMRARRGRDDMIQLCNGPAKLVQALGITKQDYGAALWTGDLRIQNTDLQPEVLVGPRIGISKAQDKPLRFWIKDNQYVSG